MTFAACFNGVELQPTPSPVPASAPPPAITPSPTNPAQVATVVASSIPTPAQPDLSSSEAISIVQNFLRGEAQTPIARMELSKIYDAYWEAVYKGSGEWGVKGVGSWNLFEKTKTVQPADDSAKSFMKVLVSASLSPSPTPTPVPTPIPQPTPNPTPNPTPQPIASPTPTPSPQSADRREGLVPINSFVATPGYNPAVDIRQIIQVQAQLDRIFKERYGIPYYGGFPDLSKIYEPHDASKLQMALKDLRGLTQWKYVLNKFDCSNMSALTQFYLANAGFKTVMVIGQDPNAFNGHAWVVVLISGLDPQAVPVEATTPGGPAIPDKGSWSYIARGVTGTQTYDDYVTKGWAVQDIYQAAGWVQRHYGETLGPDNEFNWWDTTQVNWSLLRRSAPTPTQGVPTPTITPSALPPTPVRPAAVTIIPQSASAGATVNVTGQGFTPNGTIPNMGIVIGGIVGNTAPVFISADGSFSYSFILTSDLPAGAYAVQVTDIAGRRASGALTVTRTQAPTPATIVVSPASTIPGKQITVNGRNFTPYATVKSADILFGNVASAGPLFNVDSAGNVAFIFPISANRSPGTFDIVVTDSSGKRARAAVTVVVHTALKVSPTSVTPGSGVTLAGSGFTPYGTISVGAITVGGVSLNKQAISLNVDGGFTYVFNFTPGWKGTYDIVVTDSSGKRASASVTVTVPTTLTVSPTSAPIGSPVTLAGVGFTSYGTIPAGGVTVGGVSFNTRAISLDASGNFTYAFSFTSGNGSYAIVVTDSSGKRESATITINPIIVPSNTPPPLKGSSALPNMYYGKLTFYRKVDKSDAYSAPAGSKVSAVIGGTVWETQPSVKGQGFEYSITIRARYSPEKTINFYVDGIKADQTATWIESAVNQLDLTVRLP